MSVSTLINPRWRELASDPENLEMVRNVVRWWATRRVRHLADEFASVAHFRLCIIAQQYEDERATCPFPPYLFVKLNHDLKDFCRSMRVPGFEHKDRKPYERSQELVSNFLFDRRHGDDPIPLESERFAFERRIRLLSIRKRSILRLRYLEGMTFAAIGEEMGACESRIWKLHREAIDELRLATVAQSKQG